MSISDSPAIRDFVSDPKHRVVYERERVVGTWLDLVGDAMERNNQSQADIARLLDRSRQYVSKVMRGPANLKVDTLVAIGLAAGISFVVTSAEADAALLPERAAAVPPRLPPPQARVDDVVYVDSQHVQTDAETSNYRLAA